MDPDSADHQPSSTPLFYAISTGTYNYRYRDARTDTRAGDIQRSMQNTTTSISKPEDADFRRPAAGNLELESESKIFASTTTAPLREDDEASGRNDAYPFHPTEITDLILYRETVAVLNGSMTLLSKQVGIEAPQTGAKGRAREREARRFAAARIMPSQGLVDAAKGLGGGKRSGGMVSYPLLTAEGYLIDQGIEEREERVRKSNEMLLVGCGADHERTSRERGLSPPIISNHAPLDADSSSSLSNIENRVVVDGKWVSDTGARQLLALHPDSESWSKNPERETRQRERSRLLNENALLRRQVARLEEAAARRREEEALRDEEECLRTELQRLKTEADGRELDEEPAIARTLSGDLAENEDLWKDVGLGNQPRRSANRGNRVGASLMSQEVMVEHPSAGKGRAREREEKRCLQNLAREPSRSDSDCDHDENDRRRRSNWRNRELADSEEYRDTNGSKSKGDIDTSSGDEHRGRKSFRDAARSAALSHLPPDVLAKYGPGRPPRIWREHSHEILVEAANGGGSKGRRREVNLKNERGAGGRLRFRPPMELVDAAKEVNGVDGMRDEDDRRRRREGAFRQQLPAPRFMPSQEMAEAAAMVDRGENAFLSDEEKYKERGRA